PTKYMSIENNSIINLVVSHLITSVIASLVWLYSGYFLLKNIFESHIPFLESTLLLRFVIGLLLFLLIIILNYVFIYYENFKNKLTEKAELAELVKEAELKSLRYQINPHFIFNSLNSISSLTISNPEKARDMSINLSNFLRKTLTSDDKPKLKLSEELENVKLYLEIEKVRFDDRFEFNMNISDNCENYEIPNMILQPIVENAIKHGVYESIEKVIINFDCILENNFLIITVTNNFDPTAVSNIGEGIGLKNINDRLKLMYNRSNLITTKNEEKLFIVTLQIPINIDN
ncbi:MAG: histidine kinase, partial [Bacteroidota bacterium]